jgi:hypothetical protein
VCIQKNRPLLREYKAHLLPHELTIESICSAAVEALSRKIDILMSLLSQNHRWESHWKPSIKLEDVGDNDLLEGRRLDGEYHNSPACSFTPDASYPTGLSRTVYATPNSEAHNTGIPQCESQTQIIRGQMFKMIDTLILAERQRLEKEKTDL